MTLSSFKFKDKVIFIIPVFVLFTGLMIIPLFQSFSWAFFNWSGSSDSKEFVGLDNFVQLFKDRVTYIALKNNILLLIISLVVLLPTAVIFAYWSILITKKLQRYISLFVYLPNIIPPVIVGIIWTFIFNYNFGPINTFLKLFLENDALPLWLSSKKMAIYIIAFVNLWQYTGIHYLLFYAAFSGIPTEIIDAANVDGVGKWGLLFKIIIPNTISAFKVNVILIAIGIIKIFDIVYAMTSGGPADATQVLASLMYERTFLRSQFGYGSLLATTIFVFALLITIVFNTIFKKLENKYEA